MGFDGVLSLGLVWNGTFRTRQTNLLCNCISHVKTHKLFGFKHTHKNGWNAYDCHCQHNNTSFQFFFVCVNIPYEIIAYLFLFCLANMVVVAHLDVFGVVRRWVKVICISIFAYMWRKVNSDETSISIDNWVSSLALKHLLLDL